MSFEIQVDMRDVVMDVENAKNKAQYNFVNQVRSDIRPYVPFLDGGLSNSSYLSNDNTSIIYAMPYAARLYYNPQFNFTKTHHPLAGGEWDVRAAADHMGTWEHVAKKGVSDNL